jgi:hypothetical protein
VYNGWFCLGGVEIINNTRAWDYARSAACPVTWFKTGRCDGMNDRLDQPPYDFATINQAPWYDPDNAFLSAEFLGIYCLTVDGIDDETVEAPVQERIISGGVIGRQRDASKQVRFRVILTGTSANGREYGRAWLASVLRENLCGTHTSGSCGTGDLRFMTQCPFPFDPNAGYSKGMYWDTMDSWTRILHGVKCTTGLIKEQEWERNGAYGAIYEFTLTAEEPRMLGLPYFLVSQNSGGMVVQDAPFNLHPTPSAELDEGTVEAARNYSLNPGVETDATGWAKSQDGVVILAAQVVGSRVVGELQAEGTASYRVVWTAAGASAVPGWFASEQEVALPALGRKRFSINIWSAQTVNGGAPVRGAMEVIAYWRSSSGGPILRTDALGNIPLGGGNITAKSVQPPGGSTHVLVRVRANVESWNAGSIIRLYSDALAVTNP